MSAPGRWRCDVRKPPGPLGRWTGCAGRRPTDGRGQGVV